MGGVVLLKLSSTKPDNFNEIATLIRNIVSGDFKTVALYDLDNNRYYQDIQIYLSAEGTPAIRYTRLTEGGTLRVATHYFNDITGNYSKKVITYKGLIEEV